MNLLLNRASPWVDVDSHLPCEGRVVLRIKDATALAVCVPAQVERTEVTCRVNGQERAYSWSGHGAEIDDPKPGDTVTVQFPVGEETFFTVIGDEPPQGSGQRQHGGGHRPSWRGVPALSEGNLQTGSSAAQDGDAVRFEREHPLVMG